MLKIGLTGGIGCGKSTVCNLFTELGVSIIDTDILARQSVLPGSVALGKLVQNFGEDILTHEGKLDRRKLRKIAFEDSEQLERIECIIHPEIRALLHQRLQEPLTPYIIIAIPLLFEKEWQTEVDRILVVDCTEPQQIERASTRDGAEREMIRSIMRKQVSRSNRLDAADDIIHNDSDLAALRPQVERLHNYYTSLSAHSNRNGES